MAMQPQPQRRHGCMWWTLVVCAFLFFWPFFVFYWIVKWGWPRFWPWFQAQSRQVRAAVVAGVIVCCVVVGVASAAQSPSTADTTSASSGSQLVQSQATNPVSAPAATATATPAPTATATPVPTDTPVPPPACIPGAVNCNPWGYNFSPGNYIYQPPSDFCSYFNCIPSFWNQTNGYVVECHDATFSHSGGRSGACSYHGGEWRPLYSH